MPTGWTTKKVEIYRFPYVSSLRKLNRARRLLVTIIAVMMIVKEMIVTLPTAAAAPAIGPTMFLSGGGVMTSIGK